MIVFWSDEDLNYEVQAPALDGLGPPLVYVGHKGVRIPARRVGDHLPHRPVLRLDGSLAPADVALRLTRSRQGSVGASGPDVTVLIAGDIANAVGRNMRLVRPPLSDDELDRRFRQMRDRTRVEPVAVEGDGYVGSLLLGLRACGLILAGNPQDPVRRWFHGPLDL